MLLIYGTAKEFVSRGVVTEILFWRKALFHRLAVLMLITFEAVYVIGY